MQEKHNLVERLKVRADHRRQTEGGPAGLGRTVEDEAAERIAELETEIANLKDLLREAHDCIDPQGEFGAMCERIGAVLTPPASQPSPAKEQAT